MSAWFLRSMLNNLLRAKVQEQVVQTVRERMGQAQADAAATAAATECDLGLVFALEDESGGFQDRLSGVLYSKGHGFAVRRGHHGSTRVVLLQSGAGRAAAGKAAEALLDGHRPPLVISAGFAGGLSPAVARNDIVVADSIVSLGDEVRAFDVPVDRSRWGDARGVHVGRLVTVDRIIADPAEKRTICEAHAALACDMETAAVAEVCLRRHVPFLAVRVVSDAVNDRLPTDLDPLLRQKTQMGRLGAALGTLWNRPASAKDLWTLKERAMESSRRLGAFLLRLIEPPAD